MPSALSLASPNHLLGVRDQPRRLVPRATAVAMTTASPSTLYDVLGVRSGATCREIKAAYRRLARECHPDAVVAEKKGESADEFIRIHAAYTTLSDPDKRADYDRGVVIGRPRGWRVFSASGSHHPIFTGSARRTWETDQCW